MTKPKPPDTTLRPFVFQGDYQTNVQLPDLSVVLAQPGETVELPFTDPGPLWLSAKKETS